MLSFLSVCGSCACERTEFPRSACGHLGNKASPLPLSQAPGQMGSPKGIVVEALLPSPTHEGSGVPRALNGHTPGSVLLLPGPKFVE